MNGAVDFGGEVLSEEFKKADAGKEAICLGSEGVHGARVASSDALCLGNDDGADCDDDTEASFPSTHASISDDDSGR